MRKILNFHHKSVFRISHILLLLLPCFFYSPFIFFEQYTNHLDRQWPSKHHSQPSTMTSTTTWTSTSMSPLLRHKNQFEIWLTWSIFPPILISIMMKKRSSLVEITMEWKMTFFHKNNQSQRSSKNLKVSWEVRY